MTLLPLTFLTLAALFVAPAPSFAGSRRDAGDWPAAVGDAFNDWSALHFTNKAVAALSPADQALAGRAARYMDADPRLVRLAVQKARRYGADPELVLAVIKRQSGFDPKAHSKEGDTRGLMQVNPDTAKELGVKGSLYDPGTNLDAGIRYLRKMQNQFGDTNKALLAYKLGPGAVAPKPTCSRCALKREGRNARNIMGTWDALRRNDESRAGS